MRFLVTGGAGYIGSHAVVALLQAGFEVVVLDDLSNSSPVALERVEKIAGRAFSFYRGNISDRTMLATIFNGHKIDVVLHFAGSKAVSESIRDPLFYYSNNVSGSLALLEVMASFGVFNIIFSSSATVYGIPTSMPISEAQGHGVAHNPYGETKQVIERILTGLVKSDNRWSVAILRYFNPIGAHFSGLIGESPNGTPNNLLPYILQVAVGRLNKLMVFGGDYPTIDGTGVRDYIHVLDLVEGHLAAAEYIAANKGLGIWNLGTGQGYSVLQVLSSFKDVTGFDVPYEITARRPGDIASCWADSGKASRDLGWTAKRSLSQMLEDSWRWQKNNPQGY